MTSKDMTSLSFESIAIPGAMVAQGRCQATVFPGDSAIETIATKLAVERAGGYTTDLMDRPLGKFELVERRGKYDLDLSCGAIMSANDELPCMISRMINRAAYC
jgi:fructose-1,6-bisphosphatase/inositol monophosphatase family enzyme